MVATALEPITEPVYCVLKLHVENLSRISVVDITPKPDVTELVGKNQSGKSSCLDAIAFMVRGIKALRPEPIRNGKNYAAVVASIGTANGEVKYTVERSLERFGKPALVIRDSTGKKLRSAETLLDDLTHDLGFDPEAFIHMKPKEQADELKRISGLGDTIDELDAANARDFEERTELNRQFKTNKISGESITVPEGLPESRVDVAKLVDELQKINAANALIEKRKQGRATHGARVLDLRKRAGMVLVERPGIMEGIQSRCDARVADLMRQIEAAKAQCVKDLNEAETKSVNEYNLLTKEADEIQAKLDSAEPIPEEQSTFEVENLIASADEANRGIAAREQQQTFFRAANAAFKKSQALTEAMEARTAEKQRLIAESKLPVPGLGLTDGEVTLDGKPFAAASDGVKWRVVAAIAMAGDKPLRVCLIRRASLIDDENIEIIKSVAKARKYQLFLEWVGSNQDDHEGAILLVDGTVAA